MMDISMIAHDLAMKYMEHSSTPFVRRPEMSEDDAISGFMQEYLFALSSVQNWMEQNNDAKTFRVTLVE